MGDINIVKDSKNKKITVEKMVNAPREKVWQAWTDSNILEKWWGPDGWPASTKTFSFSPGGHWHYKMTGPEGTEAWSWLEYRAIDPPTSFTAMDQFCDFAGNPNLDMPTTQWTLMFNKVGDHSTKIITTLYFDKESDMQKIVDTGFEAGYTNSLSNLEKLLEDQ
jgi:uncharacterized protein YndB with AHSA1/START domain